MLLLLFHKNVELYHSSWSIQKLTYRAESLWVIDSRSTFIDFKEAGFKTKTRFFKDIFPQISSEINRSLVFRKSNSYLDFWCLRFQHLAIFVRMLCLKMSLYHDVWHRLFFRNILFVLLPIIFNIQFLNFFAHYFHCMYVHKLFQYL